MCPLQLSCALREFLSMYISRIIVFLFLYSLEVLWEICSWEIIEHLLHKWYLCWSQWVDTGSQTHKYEFSGEAWPQVQACLPLKTRTISCCHSLNSSSIFFIVCKTLHIWEHHEIPTLLSHLSPFWSLQLRPLRVQRIRYYLRKCRYWERDAWRKISE